MKEETFLFLLRIFRSEERSQGDRRRAGDGWKKNCLKKIALVVIERR